MAIVPAAGRGVGEACEIRSDVSAVMLPQRKEAGRTIVCEDVFHIALAMCGATMPTNPSGPQYAVTAPVIMQQLSMAWTLIVSGAAPAISANSSPNSMMSRPLRPRNAMMAPMAVAAAITAIPFHVVEEKLPADQL